MSYHRAPTTGARGWRAGRGVGMGDATIPTLPGAKGSSNPSGSSNPVVYLVAQVNRFTGPGAPDGYSFNAVPFDLPLATGNLESGPAIVAVTISMRRASDAFDKFGDQASRDQITQAAAGLVSPVDFVMSNLQAITQSIELFGNEHHAPPAVGPGITSSFTFLSSPVVLALGVGVALYLFTRRR